MKKNKKKRKKILKKIGFLITIIDVLYRKQAEDDKLITDFSHIESLLFLW